jgi:hypothetical protein
MNNEIVTQGDIVIASLPVAQMLDLSMSNIPRTVRAGGSCST